MAARLGTISTFGSQQHWFEHMYFRVHYLYSSYMHMDVGHEPLSTGLVYRARENQIPKVFGFCLRLESGFLLVFGTGLISELPNPAAGENCLHFSILDRKTELL